jgi:hypothetical protein
MYQECVLNYSLFCKSYFNFSIIIVYKTYFRNVSDYK